jgi:signal transduction histidine kinase
MRRRFRLTLRLKLALMYAAVFFITGLILIAIPLLGVQKTVPAGSGQPPQGGTPHIVGIPQPIAVQMLGVVVLAVVSFGLGWLIAGRLLRPLRAITATARDISATNLHRRLDLSGRHDEFGELGDTLDGLLERLEASFESQRHFVANASHELRTPLTAERTVLQVALADPDASAGTLRAACEEVLTLSRGQERLIEALLTLASGEQGIEHREPLDLAGIARKVVTAREQEAKRRDVRVEAALGPAAAAGDPSLAESLVANLVDNAVCHNVRGGWVEVATAMAAGRAVISVRNSGPVIPPAEVGRLFEPFQRLDRQRTRHGERHGLGLAIVQAIARAHGAALVARARPEGGLDVEACFPLRGRRGRGRPSGPPAPGAPARPRPSAPGPGRPAPGAPAGPGPGPAKM